MPCTGAYIRLSIEDNSGLLKQAEDVHNTMGDTSASPDIPGATGTSLLWLPGNSTESVRQVVAEDSVGGVLDPSTLHQDLAATDTCLRQLEDGVERIRKEEYTAGDMRDTSASEERPAMTNASLGWPLGYSTGPFEHAKDGVIAEVSTSDDEEPQALDIGECLEMKMERTRNNAC